MGINFFEQDVPDATTLLHFRHLLEEHGIGKLFFGIHPGMAFHTEMPLISLFCLVHFGVSLLFRVLGGAGLLEIMDEIIPWDEWVGIIRPYYPTGERGRPPIEIEIMLRIFAGNS